MCLQSLKKRMNLGCDKILKYNVVDDIRDDEHQEAHEKKSNDGIQ